MSDQIHQILSNGCSCEVQMRETVFDCLSPHHDFVLFRGLLFAPVSTTSAALLSLLEDWVSSGPHQLTIVSTNSVSSVCRPGEMYADSPECVEFNITTTTLTPRQDSHLTTTALTSPSTTSTPTVVTVTGGLETQESSEDFPVALMAGVAIGSFLVGTMSGFVVALICYLLRQR